MKKTIYLSLLLIFLTIGVNAQRIDWGTGDIHSQGVQIDSTATTFTCSSDNIYIHYSLNATGDSLNYHIEFKNNYTRIDYDYGVESWNNTDGGVGNSDQGFTYSTGPIYTGSLPLNTNELNHLFLKAGMDYYIGNEFVSGDGALIFSAIYHPF